MILRLFGCSRDLASAVEIIGKDNKNVAFYNTEGKPVNYFNITKDGIVLGLYGGGVSKEWNTNGALRIGGPTWKETYELFAEWWKKNKSKYIDPPKPVPVPAPPKPIANTQGYYFADLESYDPGVVTIAKGNVYIVSGIAYEAPNGIDRVEILNADGTKIGEAKYGTKPILESSITFLTSVNTTGADVNKLGFQYTIDTSNGSYEENKEYVVRFFVRPKDGSGREISKRITFKIAASNPPYNEPVPPVKVPYPPFNIPYPAFNSDVKTISKYSYFFGLDRLKLMNKTINQNCCFLSQEISIGQLNEGEYIQLEAEYVSDDDSTVEFSILDGNAEVPIMPLQDATISNEKVFFGLTSRFGIDPKESVVVKKDGVVTLLTFEQAKQLNDAVYTVSYTPMTPYNYTPINSSIKLKIIQRLYNKNGKMPYIKKLKIRKYGGNALWIEDISIM